MSVVRIFGVFAGIGVFIIAMVAFSITPEQISGSNSSQVTLKNPNQVASTFGLDDEFEVILDFNEILKCENENATHNELCFTTQSIINEDVPKIANSNNDFVQNFLDSISGTKAIGVETAVTLYDLAGNNKTSNSIIPVPLTLETEGGFFPDNVQVAFFAITQGNDVTALNLVGDVEFRLDDVKVGSDDYRLWVSANVVNQQVIPLIITDYRSTSLNKPPPAVDRQDTFDFTFTDEGFEDGSVHTFSVVIKELDGNVNGEFFSWRGEFVAYKLQMTVDEKKIVILDESGDAVSVFKTDSTVSSCSRSSYVLGTAFTVNRNTLKYSQVVPATTALSLSVFDSDGNLVGDIPQFKTTKEGKPVGGAFGSLTGSKSPVFECKKINIMRGSDYTVKINGKEFDIKTPVTQKNYFIEYTNINANGGGAKIDFNVRCSEWRDISHCASAPSYQQRPLNAIYEKATSNFGFEYNSVPCEGAKVNIGAVADRGRFGTTNHEKTLSMDELPENIRINCMN